MKKLSMVLNVVLILCLLFVGYKYEKLKSSPNSTDALRTEIRMSSFDALKGKDQNKIVFLGDSLTEFNPLNELLKGNIANRGISGETSSQILNRLHQVTSIQPKKIFIMMGINDLIQGQKPSVILNNYQKVLSSIKSTSPNSKIYVESILPINNDVSKSKISNVDIANLDNQIKQVASQDDAKYIDLYDAFIKNGQLPKSLTIDGYHLKGEGYKIWADTIQKYVEE